MDENTHLNHSAPEQDDDYERAAEWLDIMADGAMDELTQRRFALWFNGNEQRRIIFERMSVTWNDHALQRAAEPYAKSITTRPSLAAKAINFFATPRAVFALCLGLLVGVTGFYIGSLGDVKSAQHLAVNSAFQTKSIFQTNIAQHKNYQLVDGSTLELSPHTKININFYEQRRNLELAQGAAYFQVAHDKTRPFDVHIGAVSVVAVGTEFNIDKNTNVVDITVYEGIVEVRKDKSAAPQRLYAGTRARIANNQIYIEAVDIAKLVDWRSGWIEVKNESLGFLVEHLNRYATTKIVVPSAEVNNIRVAGRFQLQNWQETLAMLADLYQLDINKHADHQELRKRSGKGS